MWTGEGFPGSSESSTDNKGPEIELQQQPRARGTAVLAGKVIWLSVLAMVSKKFIDEVPGEEFGQRKQHTLRLTTPVPWESIQPSSEEQRWADGTQRFTLGRVQFARK